MFKSCSKPTTTNITPEEEYQIWLKDLFSNKSKCECVTFTSFENDLYYVEASMFYDKKDNEPIGLKKYSKKSLVLEDINQKNSDKCSICLSTLQKRKNSNTCCKIVGCNHVFHTKCLNKYISSKKEMNQQLSCPICRYSEQDDSIEIEKLKKFRCERQTIN